MRTQPYVRILSFTLALALIIACNATPTSPTLVADGALPTTPHAQQGTMVVPIEDGPPHDLRVVVEEGFAPGEVGYLCSTQPRQYINPKGDVSYETDYYVQRDRCPSVRIP